MGIEKIAEQLAEYVDIKEGKEGELADFLGGKVLTPETARKYLETAISMPTNAEERAAIQPVLDRYVTKGIDKGVENWKSNHLEMIIEEEIAKRNPGETPEQKRIRVLEQKLAEQQHESQRLKLSTRAKDLAVEHGVPASLAEYFIGQDEEGTENNLMKVKTELDNLIAQEVTSRFKTSGREVHQNTRTFGRGDLEKMKADLDSRGAKMKLEDRIKLRGEIKKLEME